MAANTNVQIYIGNESISSFKSFTLDQEIDKHHSFELICRKDVLEHSSSSITESSINFLGEIFLLKIRPENSYSENETLDFKGVVTSVNTVKGFQHKGGDLVHILGKSSSIIADDGPHYASHQEIGLSEIIEKTFRGYNKAALQLAIHPKKTTPIHYSVQQEESSFEYASRLAAQYGEWFYYNGTQLVFGKPEQKEAITLLYGFDLLEFSMNMNTIPNSFKFFTNDYLNDTFHEVETKKLQSNVNGYASRIHEKSNQLFYKETQVFVSAYDDPQMKHRIDEQVKQQKTANEINQIKVTGKSSNPGLHIGSIVQIKEGNTSHGTYRITKLVQNCNENGRYENSFEGVTAAIDAYPKTSLKAFPKSKSQTAVVVDNVDPKGMGRVKVQYAWQKATGQTSPWIRQSSLAGGPGQGMYFVPEKGDEVIVGFEGGNAESPIVQGSVTNASSVPESFKSDNNHLKAIKTRSGNQVTLNDADGSVTIADPSGNTIVMGGNGEITINAPNKITFSSTDIVMEASNDWTVNAGNNISSKAATNISANAGVNMNMDAGANIKAKAGASATVNGDKSVSIFGKRVAITGAIMANIQSGAMLTVMTMGILNLTGAAKNLLNGSKVTILGKRVEIND